jgi:hypothetical protein
MIEAQAEMAQIQATRPRRTLKSRRFLRLVAATALAAGVLGAGTQATLAFGSPLQCSSPAQSTVFAPWGDNNTYFQISNGGFENGAVDWSLGGGASVVSGNESYYVAGSGDSHSLRITPNGYAESRTMCVSMNQDVVRLFVNNQHVSGAILHVDAIAQNPQTGGTAWTSFDVNGDVPSSPWSPTMQLKIPNMFGGNSTENLTLRFTLRGAAATWYIDDVFLDPFKSW